MRTIVFGSQRIAAIWGLRNNVRLSQIMLATNPDVGQFISGEKELTVVRASEDAWRPPTFPCEQRCRDAEYEIKGRKEHGVKVTEVVFQ